MEAKFHLTIRNDKKKAGLSPIHLRITLKQKSVYRSTGIRVSPENWSVEGQRILGRKNDNQVKLDNETLENKKHLIQSIQNDFIKLGKEITLERLVGVYDNNGVEEDTCKTVIEYLHYYLKGKKAEGTKSQTLKKYYSFAVNLRAFVSETGKEQFKVSKVDHKFMEEFYHWMCNRKYESGIKKDKPILSTNTKIRYTNILKTVLFSAMKNKELTDNNFTLFKGPKRNKPNQLFLTARELQQLKKADMNSASLEIIRDLFLVQCYTGMPYAELRKFSPEHIIKDEKGNKIIRIPRSKSTEEKLLVQVVPVHFEVERLLEKYSYHKGPGFFPVLSNPCMNRELKNMANMANLNKALTTHSARRTFGTILINAGMPAPSIIKMLGHTSFKELATYAKLDEDTLVNDMRVFEQKLIS